MKKTLLLCAMLLFLLLLAGCGNSLEGKYASKEKFLGKTQTLELSEKQKAYLDVGPGEFVGEYETDGDKLIVKTPHINFAFTINKDGSLTGKIGTFEVVFVKQDS